jgi:hypothetical protein
MSTKSCSRYARKANTACTTALTASATALLLCHTKGTLIHRNPVLIWNKISKRFRTPNTKIIEPPPNYYGFAATPVIIITAFAGPALPWMLQLASAITSVLPDTLILTSFVKTVSSGRLLFVYSHCATVFPSTWTLSHFV